MILRMLCLKRIRLMMVQLMDRRSMYSPLPDNYKYCDILSHIKGKSGSRISESDAKITIY